MSPYIIPGLKRSLMFPDIADTRERIIAIILNYRGQTRETIASRSRTRDRVYTRQLCMYVIKKHCQISLKAIGRVLGGYDHSSVIHGIDTISDLMDSDKAVAMDVAKIQNLVL